MRSENGERRGVPLHTKILLGLLLGAAAGVTANQTLGTQHEGLLWFVNNVAQPVGQIFLRMLFMVVVPLVFASLTLGVAGLGDLAKVGRVGAKTIAFFIFTTALAATIGLVAVNFIQPGNSMDPATRAALLQTYAQQAADTKTLASQGGFGINTFVNIVPRNPIDAMARGDMLGIIFFSLVLGIALTRLKPETAAPFMKALEGLGLAVTTIIGFAMHLAPYGVFGLIFSVTARFGFEVLQSLALYVIMVLTGLLVHQFGVIGTLAKIVGGINPGTFFKRARYMMITAFSTSSSNATLPTTLRTAEEEFGVPREIAGFVIPLGATMNMNGTALFEGMTVLFLAQVFGIDLSIGSQIIVIAMSVLTAIGAAGVPGGSIPLLVMVLEMVGIPGEGIALILGVDRILDMTRTVPNVTGDLLTSIVVARSEKYALVPAVAPDFSPEAAIEVAHDTVTT
jgi:DAACS family dicarboxylate/amino acid:cation (Na+ or H+) symporter